MLSIYQKSPPLWQGKSNQLRFDQALTAVLGKPTGLLAGKSTLNRLEHAGKIGLDRRHSSGYYDCYCCLPLYIFCRRHLLAAKLRSSSMDAAAGCVEEVARIVAHIRARWPETDIMTRADSGFCRDDLLSWCEANTVSFIIGLAGNRRLTAGIKRELAQAERQFNKTGQPACSRTSATAPSTAGIVSAASSRRPSGRHRRPTCASS